MDQTERVHKFEKLLRQNKFVSFAVLQAALEVSRARLKRDLDDLRNRSAGRYPPLTFWRHHSLARSSE
jgi:DeoR/GlpR family transcriptional regulator of sugar metabolism